MATKKFSCSNQKYRTNTIKGFAHGSCATKGSVLKEPIIVNDDEDSLWLEHVEEINTGQEVYWLMWYDSSGKPNITMSAIFNKDELGEMIKQLVTCFAP